MAVPIITNLILALWSFGELFIHGPKRTLLEIGRRARVLRVMIGQAVGTLSVGKDVRPVVFGQLPDLFRYRRIRKKADP